MPFFPRLKSWVRNSPRLHMLAVRRSEFRKMRARVKKFGEYASKTFHINHEKKLIYLSNSKVACSSIKASMYRVSDAAADYRAVHRITNAQKHYELSLPWDKYPDYYKFTFVRNPFARLVSCYVNKLIEDKKRLGKDMRCLYFEKYLFGYLNVDKGFHNWAARACRVPDRYADRHFVSQSFLIHDRKGHMLVNEVFNFENLARDYEAIRVKYDLEPLPHYNKTNRGNWMDYYDERTARRVYRRYRRDIEEFGYRDAYDELIKYIRKGNVAS
jgi:hypothetical protein